MVLLSCPLMIIMNDGLDFKLDNCDTTGARNVSDDPLFCDPAAEDFTLCPNSPCTPTAPSGAGRPDADGDDGLVGGGGEVGTREQGLPTGR